MVDCNAYELEIIEQSEWVKQRIEVSRTTPPSCPLIDETIKIINSCDIDVFTKKRLHGLLEGIREINRSLRAF